MTLQVTCSHVTLSLSKRSLDRAREEDAAFVRGAGRRFDVLSVTAVRLE